MRERNGKKRKERMNEKKVLGNDREEKRERTCETVKSKRNVSEQNRKNKKRKNKTKQSNVYF